MTIQPISLDIGKAIIDDANNIDGANSGFQDILSEKVGKITIQSIEQILKVKYPTLSYHVCDASEFKYWNRLDFPMSEVFKDTLDVDKLKQWTPSTSNATGYEDYVQADCMRIPRGSYAIIIHPDVQKRMENDFRYAQEIMKKIDRHFQDTIRINENLSPGCTDGLSQAVCIDEKGDVFLQASIGDGPDYVDPPKRIMEEDRMMHEGNKKHYYNKTVSIQDSNGNYYINEGGSNTTNYDIAMSTMSVLAMSSIMDKKKK